MPERARLLRWQAATQAKYFQKLQKDFDLWPCRGPARPSGRCTPAAS